jgi:hypothetical protein
LERLPKPVVDYAQSQRLHRRCALHEEALHLRPPSPVRIREHHDPCPTHLVRGRVRGRAWNGRATSLAGGR